MGAVVDRLALTLAEAKTFLRVDSSEEDTFIQDLIDGAMEKADEFCNNPFTVDGTDTGTPLEIPKTVKRWCLGLVARGYELRPNGLTTDYSRDISQNVWGDIDYGSIYSYRMEPGF